MPPPPREFPTNRATQRKCTAQLCTPARSLSFSFPRLKRALFLFFLFLFSLLVSSLSARLSSAWCRGCGLKIGSLVVAGMPPPPRELPTVKSHPANNFIYTAQLCTPLFSRGFTEPQFSLSYKRAEVLRSLYLQHGCITLFYTLYLQEL
jgi:hypothetical protein